MMLPSARFDEKMTLALAIQMVRDFSFMNGTSLISTRATISLIAMLKFTPETSSTMARNRQISVCSLIQLMPRLST